MVGLFLLYLVNRGVAIYSHIYIRRALHIAISPHIYIPEMRGITGKVKVK